MAEISEKQLKVLEKLLGDEEFRAGFFEDPDAAIAKAGIDLNEEELAGLRGVDATALTTVLLDLDTRLSKTGVGTGTGVGGDIVGNIVGAITGAGPTGF
jgi:hypothetical protein